MRRRLIPVCLLAALVPLTLAACGGGDDKVSTPTPISPPPPPPAVATPTTVPEPTDTSAPVPGTGGRVVEVINRDLGGSGEYRFDPKEFSFEVGETVTFRVTAQTEFHTFNVDELGIDQGLNPGKPVEFAVTFDQAGTFRLYCIPHEAFGMEGTITVQ